MEYYEKNITYDDDYIDEVCNKERVVKFGSIATPAFFSVVTILSLAGNILVLVILAKYENLKSLTNIFILNLALSDLVFTFGLPFWAAYHIWGWTFGWFLCKTVTFVFYAGFYSSVLFLTIMTIHRYLAVVHPLSDHGSQKGCYGVTVSLIIWAISFGSAVPALIFSSVQENPHKEDKHLHCEYSVPLWKKVSTCQQNVFFLAAFAIMGFCYVRILRTIFKSRSHTRNRTMNLIFSIVAVFFLGWAPYNVVIFLRLLTDNSVAPFTDCEVSMKLDYGFYVCRLIAFSHCCLNPVFYAFVGIKFRNHLKVVLQKLCWRQSTIDSQQIRATNVPSRESMY
ncbi:chemokine XC receptor 1-like [Salvelinus fontinalis]|uniref:chemokine XC receptor 1-like n=1 Tax=Salvelinus fontinalis TaxID=8038 RepID=UPI0024855CA8|nr:chemokine XC receptor 1-like [Salvelinus fontinalis]